MSDKDLRHIFATNVRAQRYLQELSQEDLANLCGLHRTYISDIEREERNVSIDNVQKIAVALNIEPSKLLEESNEDNTRV